MKLAIRAALAIAATYFVLCAVAGLFQRKMIYPTWAVREINRPLPQNTEKVGIITKDNEILKALWLPPQNRSGPVIISFSGNTSPAEGAIFRFAGSPWHTHGWGVLSIAYRGYPGSTGRPSEPGLLLDADAAVAFVRREMPDAKILLHGHSLGSAIAVAAASRHPAIGLYLEAPFNDMTSAVHDRYPFLPTFLLLDRYQSDQRLPAVKCPLMFVHGALDAAVGPELGQKLFDARSPGPDQSFHLITKADHNSVYGVEDVTAEAFFFDRPEIPPAHSTYVAISHEASSRP